MFSGVLPALQSLLCTVIVVVSARIVVERDRVEWTVRLHVRIVLPGGMTLYAQAGPAILLTSTDDQWLIPVHDADLVADHVLRRQALWLQGDL